MFIFVISPKNFADVEPEKARVPVRPAPPAPKTKDLKDKVLTEDNTHGLLNSKCIFYL